MPQGPTMAESSVTGVYTDLLLVLETKIAGSLLESRCVK